MSELCAFLAEAVFVPMVYAVGSELVIVFEGVVVGVEKVLDVVAHYGEGVGVDVGRLGGRTCGGSL